MALSSFDSCFAENMVGLELEQFGIDVTYTPAGGASKTIKAIILGETRTTNPASVEVEEFDSMEIVISARDDIEGHVQPSFVGRGGTAGDTVAFDMGYGVETWYVRDDLDVNVAGMHRLGINTKQHPFAPLHNV